MLRITCPDTDRAFTQLIALLALLLPLAANAGVYLTRDRGDDLPDTRAFSSFQCNDTIYAVLQGIWPAGSSHLIEARWIDPGGRQRERTRLRFDAVDGVTRAWVWLRLHRGSRNLLDKLLMEEDTSLQEFVGEWTIIFDVDGKTQRKTRFQVSC